MDKDIIIPAHDIYCLEQIEYTCAASRVLMPAFTTSNRFIQIPSISFLMGQFSHPSV